ncbi:MAG TPA: MFS transporter [Candidatus Limnocylindria bacterium]|nr:MFS transporter [Candidatus Limnocylindria bacterium]
MTPDLQASAGASPLRRLMGWHDLAPLAALFFISLTLRPQLIGIAPLLPDIQAEFGMSHAIAGLLGTIPVLCMGVFALPIAWVTRRFGSRNAMLAAVGAIVVFGAVRALAPGELVLWTATVGIGIGIANAGALLPVMVKEQFSHRPGLATGVYATTIQLGTAISAALAIPIALLIGWRGTLLVFAVACAVLLLLWFVLQRGVSVMRHAEGRLAAVPLRSPLAWYLTGIFAINAFCFYGMATWLPAFFVERGWDDVAAGGALGVLNAAGLPVGLVVPWLADRATLRRPMLIVAAVLLVAGVLGVQLAPSIGFVWAALVGASLGIIFPMALLLPISAVERPADVTAILALMLGVGYSLSAAAPALLGWARDLSGTFGAAMWLMLPIALGMVVLTVLPMPRD